MDSDESGRENIPEDYIEVSDDIFATLQQNPNWIWNGEKPVPPSEAPPLTQLQIDEINDVKAKALKLKKQTEEIYIEYGKFVVMFEHMVESLRGCIRDLLCFEHGISEKYVQILIKDFKIRDLTNKISALHGLVYPDEIESKELVAKLFDKVNKLNEKRNKVVHGLWSIGFCSSNDSDFSRATRSTSKFNKGILEHIYEEFNAEQLKLLFREAAKLQGLLGRLGHCMSEPSPGKTLRNITHEMIDTGEGFRSLYHPVAPIWDKSRYDQLLENLPRKFNEPE